MVYSDTRLLFAVSLKNMILTSRPHLRKLNFHINCFCLTVIVIINIQGWAIWPVPFPELQLLSPSFLRQK